MHICFASLDYPDKTSGGGVGTYVKIIARELIRRGHRVSVIALRKGKELSDRSNDEGVNIYWITPGNIHWYVSKLPFIGKVFALPIREIEYSDAVFKAIRKIDHEEPLDIVEGIETGAFGFRSLRRGIKTVIRLHGERYIFAKYTPPGRIPVDVRISRYFQRKAFLNANQLTAPSRVHAEEIKSELKGKVPSIKVIPNPVQEVSLIKSENKNERPVFLYIGRLQLSKGILDLLKTIPLIIEKVPSAHFIVVGKEHPSVSMKTIEMMMNRLKIGSALDLLGHVNNKDLGSIYSEATAVILPSYYESFSYVCVEALMYHVPIVAYNAGAVKDIIKNGENGLLVSTGNVEALADACAKAINMRVKVSAKDELNKYSVEQVCQETIAVYENLLLRA